MRRAIRPKARDSEPVVGTECPTRQAFEQLRAVRSPSARAAIREYLVELHLPLVEHLAFRFRGRGEPLDDLIQVGLIGLLKSIDRFDLDRGVGFSTYATPTVVGEIKRHFRDKGWPIRVPRRLQEMRLDLETATADLGQLFGRSPTVGELASRLDVDEDLVLESLDSANAYSTVSLEALTTRAYCGATRSDFWADSVGHVDGALAGVEYRESLKPLLATLEARDRKILLLRFFGQLTQSQIAGELGISQMHVSRLLAQTLARLRRGLGETM